MKTISRKLFLQLGAASAMLALSACGAAAGSSSSAGGAGSSQQTSLRTVSPLPGALSVTALDDCTFAAGFTAQDVYLNDDGALVVDLEVFDYERFDAAELAALAVGDVLRIDGRELPVESISAQDSGWYEINGGLEEGGCYLACSDNDGGVYYEVLENDQRAYYSLGIVTLPVSQEFVLADSSDLEQPERTLYAGDFLLEMQQAAADGTDVFFTPYNTTVTTQNGKIAAMAKCFVP